MSHVDDGALHAYLDGELSPVERERLEAHLADCPACRARLDEERALVERASQLLGLALPPERAAPPPPLHQLRQPRVLWRLRMPLAWAASLVLAVGFGYYFAAATFRAGRQIPSANDSIFTLSGARATDSSTPAASIATAERSRQATPQAPEALRAERQERERSAAARDEVADQGGVTKARADSVALAPAIVALEPKVELRGATAAAPAAPAPPPQAVVVTGAAREAESRLAVLRGRLMTTQWPIIRRGSARELLGADPVGVPGLAVREMRRSPAGDGVVLVEQEVDSTTVIQLFQRRAEPEQAAGEALTRQRRAEGYVETERLARFIGSLRVEIAGPLTTDSLNRLLEKVKPIQ
jgi:hypothetical protein